MRCHEVLPAWCQGGHGAVEARVVTRARIVRVSMDQVGVGATAAPSLAGNLLWSRASANARTRQRGLQLHLPALRPGRPSLG